MKISQFLTFAAWRADMGMDWRGGVKPDGWFDYVQPLLPTEDDDLDLNELVATRPLRLLFGAAMARSDGK